MGSLSIWHWLIVLVVVVLIFGTKRLRNMGGDVGGAIKEFKTSMNDEKSADTVNQPAKKAVATSAIAPKKEPAEPKVPAAAKKPSAKKPVAKKPAPAKVASAAKPAAPPKAKAPAVAKKPAVKKPVAKKPATTKATPKPKAAA